MQSAKLFPNARVSIWCYPHANIRKIIIFVLMFCAYENRKKIYIVAGHCFSLTLPSGSHLWPLLTQYDPFLETKDEKTIFDLELCDSLPEEADTLIYDAPPIDGQTVVRLFSSESGLVVEMAPDHRLSITARLWMSSDFKQGRLLILKDRDSDIIFSINNSMMLLYAFASSSLSTLEMHSSVILNEGKCYMFLGHSGAGKSTHSRQWLAGVSNSILLNDDNPVVRISSEGRAVAYGSPWSGKTACYKNLSGEVAAFVCIKQAPHNAIRRMSVPETYAAIYSSSSGLKKHSLMQDALHQSIASLATKVPCMELECLPDTDAARLCHDAISKLISHD